MENEDLTEVCIQDTCESLLPGVRMTNGLMVNRAKYLSRDFPGKICNWPVSIGRDCLMSSYMNTN